ncbi:MAG TPA: flagellum-specific ATP synthase FliI, partial [Ruminococcaceae bacterium]|nr:flagellum-specific ATP synthase FliI [Oscillospiraceae bacterium]
MVDLQAALDTVLKTDPLSYKGKVKNIVGMMVEATGVDAKIGDICIVGKAEGVSTGVTAEVVGFREGSVLLMAYGDIKGIGPGST